MKTNQIIRLFSISLLILWLSPSFSQRRVPVPTHNYKHPVGTKVEPDPYEKIDDPYRKKTPQERKEEYKEYKQYLNEQYRDSKTLFFTPQKQKSQPRDDVIFITSYSKGDISFQTNYGNRKNIHFLDDYISYNSKPDFIRTFGDLTIKELSEKVKCIFEYGIDINDNVKELLKNIQTPYLLLPTGDVVKAIYVEENSRLYYKKENRDFLLEQPQSMELYLEREAILDQKIPKENDFIISFVNNDTRTQQMIQEKFHKNSTIINNMDDVSKIGDILSEHKFDRVFIFGHIEDGNYVFKNKDKNTFTNDISIPIEDINSLIKKYNLQLYTLGCESIKNSSSAGHYKEIHSIRIVEALFKAVEATTYADFFNAMSFDNNSFFVNSEHFDNQIKFVAELRNNTTKQLTKNAEVTKAVIYASVNRNTQMKGEEKSSGETSFWLDPFVYIAGGGFLGVFIWVLIKVINPKEVISLSEIIISLGVLVVQAIFLSIIATFIIYLIK